MLDSSQEFNSRANSLNFLITILRHTIFGFDRNYIFNLRHSGRLRNQHFYMETQVTIGTGLFFFGKIIHDTMHQHRTRCKNIKYLMSQKLFVLSFISYLQSTTHLPSAPATSTKTAPTHFISLLQPFEISCSDL